MFYLCSLGSNIRPLEHLPAALCQLGERLHTLTISSFIETTPWDMQTEHKFVNALGWFESKQSPSQLKQFFNQLEARHGRNRNDPLSSAKDRSLDIDLIGPVEQQAALAYLEIDPFLLLLQQQLFAKPTKALADALAINLQLSPQRCLPLGERPTTIHFN
ncbi:2-amino-4-hydroxy-6-hydroxymethyldihydropteridine diphosphokinase [Agarivorans aestuarii]|uniref:2-amino-4-hydroxy-6- hydroxymethyldihydropteridine diphosphokinase n=1 Tax=Agarivorans aestuarii TaxID=1563703 RepID=UPI001C8016AB|nr:2-amino-4-hydroxy-6-hydroxymethyldihydropteridine diphosphokinase [Agarivorans aestuarii]